MVLRLATAASSSNFSLVLLAFLCRFVSALSLLAQALFVSVIMNGGEAVIGTARRLAYYHRSHVLPPSLRSALVPSSFILSLCPLSLSNSCFKPIRVQGPGQGRTRVTLAGVCWYERQRFRRCTEAMSSAPQLKPQEAVGTI